MKAKEERWIIPQKPVLDFRRFLMDMTQPAPEIQYRLAIDGKGIITNDDITTLKGCTDKGITQFLAIAAAVMLSGRNYADMTIGNVKTNKILFCNIDYDTPDFKDMYGAVGWDDNKSLLEHGFYYLQLRHLYSDRDRIDIIDQAIEKIWPDVIIINGVHDFICPEKDNRFVKRWLNQFVNKPSNSIISVQREKSGLGEELEYMSAGVIDVSEKEEGLFVASISQRTEPASDFVFPDFSAL